MNSKEFRVIVCLLLVLVAVFSFVVLGGKYSVPEAYAGIIGSIDNNISTLLRLTGTATVASAGVTCLPDDIATPVADELADLTQYFLIALCALYAEKYILPIIGFAVFRVLVPVVCLLVIIRLFARRKDRIGQFALRILCFALTLFLAIPASVKASDVVYATYESSLVNTINSTEQLTEDVSDFSISTGTEFIEHATSLVNCLFEALAVSIATSCLIPILVLLLFARLFKLLFGASTPSAPPAPPAPPSGSSQFPAPVAPVAENNIMK